MSTNKAKLMFHFLTIFSEYHILREISSLVPKIIEPLIYYIHARMQLRRCSVTEHDGGSA